MSDIEHLAARIIAFRDARNWAQFHNPKDVALSLVLEATEVLEHFQWKNHEEVASHVKEKKEAVASELADVFYWLLLMSHDLKINLTKSLEAKLEVNEAKYPVEKSKGNHKKYNELE
jgi:NTP pyrophosphatase (non-canonical NTP hydrolase)